ncbi:5'-methylthioadenosine/S-adenosylhomocysteine nucleosidase family protein [Aspergillus aculeatinus CBS 121060]|uniref:Purine and uridine phosphorylase n=1 Tax=Aspergillus aculeatinus CBS 121060 TaxID=1448322 RepID=A0ACD1HN28_9EURO|nr:purine and uridine phosphorylase [Aspergillus aculeatinus CBS 121060]RAH75014.1 purine and uridine phosphorylase [Aspergillus aculeatinus CBS 121060]
MLSTPGSRNPEFKIGILAALPLEAHAIRGIFDQIDGEAPENDATNTFIRAPMDMNSYTTGKIANHRVVLAHMPGMGKVNAAATAAGIQASFTELKLVLIVGICGGVPQAHDPILLGDVVISRNIVPAENAIFHPYDPVSEISEHPQFGRPTWVVRSLLAKLENQKTYLEEKTSKHLDCLLRKPGFAQSRYPGDKEDQLFLPDYMHKHRNPHDCDCVQPGKSCTIAKHSSCDQLGCEPEYLVPRARDENTTTLLLHFGSIASGDQVIKSGQHRDRVAQTKNVIAFEMEGAGAWNYLPCLIIKGVCDYADSHKNKKWQRHAAAAAAASARAVLDVYESPKDEDEQTTPVRQLLTLPKGGLCRDDLAVLNEQAYMQIESTEEKATIKSMRSGPTLFDKLPCTSEAFYNHYDRQHDLLCLEGTRTAVLEDIHAWADSHSGKTMYWLTGWAGIGKSTIARTVGHSWDAQGRLGATFFFDKASGSGKRRAREFITTIAYQLATDFPVLMSFISEAMAKDPYLCFKSLGDQCQKLILRPISRARFPCNGLPIVLIVDALDNCETSEVGIVIRLLGDISSAGVRVFISSRMTPTINFHRRCEHEGRFRALELQNIPQEIINQDISLFFQRELQQLNTNWEVGDNLRKLVEKTGGNFLWASMTARYIREVPELSSRRLSMLLQPGATMSPIDAQFDGVNLDILRDAMPSNLSNKESSIYYGLLRRYLGVIAVLFVEVSPASFYQLIDLEGDGRGAYGIDIHEVLKNLQPIMDVPDDKHDQSSLFRLLHPSVGSFLTSPTRCTDERFLIDSKQAHYDAMEGCLRLLPGILERVQQETAGSTSDQSDLMVDTGDACTVWEWSPAARYACRYWVKHLEGSGAEVHPGDSVSLFIENHVHCWLKALVQMESIDEASKDLQYLASFISDTEASEFGTSLKELSISLAERKVQVEQNPSMIYQLAMEHLDRCN